MTKNTDQEPFGGAYVTGPQAADLLDVALRTIHRMVEDGRLDGERQGRTWLISAASIESHLEAKAEEIKEQRKQLKAAQA